MSKIECFTAFWGSMIMSAIFSQAENSFWIFWSAMAGVYLWQYFTLHKGDRE